MATGLIHEFWVGGTKLRQLPPVPGTVGFNEQRVGQFSCQQEISGGFASASGNITLAELAAYPSVYTMGTTWLVKDRQSGKYIFGGEIRDPQKSGGMVQLTADGWARRADHEIERALFESQSVTQWQSGDNDTIGLIPGGEGVADATKADGKFALDTRGNWLTFEVNRFQRFPQHAGAPATWVSVPWVFWAPTADINRIAFTIAKSKNDVNYELELIAKGTGPDLTTGVTTLATWGLGAGGPSSVDYAIGSTYDIIGLRVRRVGGKLRSAPGRRWTIKNLRVGGIATSDPYYLDAGMSYLAGRLGVSGGNKDISASTVSMVPYDVTRASIGQILDDISLLDNWFWRMDANPSTGERAFFAGAIGRRTWDVVETHQPITLLPSERYNKVSYEYFYGGGYTATAIATASPNPFPVGYSATYSLQMEEPPIKILADAFAQKIADYLAKARSTGSATVSEIEDPGAPGVRVPVGELRPGDELRLTNNDNTKVYVQTVGFDETGTVAEVEFTNGNPMLDRWLARRTRLLNMGMDANKATLRLLNPDRPAVPVVAGPAFYQEEGRSGIRFYNMIVDWTEVTQDIDGEATAVDVYHVRIRPLDGPAGTPITEANGGGWRRQTVREPEDDDPDLGIDTPTKTIFRYLAHPHKWYWEAQVQAIDLLGQRSQWSALTSPAIKPAAFVPTAPTGVELSVVPHKVTVEWVAPDDPDDSDAIPDWKPDVRNFQVQISSTTDGGTRWDPGNVLKQDRVRSEKKSFFIKKTRGKTFYGRVRSVDAYGNKSAWVESNSAESKPGAPTNLAIQYVESEKFKHAKFLMKCSWDELNFADADISYYVVEMESTVDEDTKFKSTEVTVRRKIIDASRDDDPGGYANSWFGRINRRRIYRFRVRAVTAGNVKGDWSSFFPSPGGSSPQDETNPPSPEEVRVFASATDRVVLEWSDPVVSIVTRGTVAGTSGTKTVTGTGTAFTKEVEAGSEVRFLIGTLNADITDSATSIFVNEDSTPPATPFVIRVRREQMNVTARSGASNPRTYTVTRGYSQTVAAAHVEGMKVHDQTTYVVKKLTTGSRDTVLELTQNLAWTLSGVKLHVIEGDLDVAFYQVQIAKIGDVATGPTPDEWSAVYKKDRSGGNRKAFKIPDADKGDTYYGRVRSVDAAFNRSKFVYGTYAGNSDPDVSGEGVVIAAGGGGTIVATWHHPGRSRVKHYAHVRYTNLTGQTLTFKKARATCGDKDLSIGAPTGSALKFNFKRWLYDSGANNEHTPQSVFTAGGGGDDDDRLSIGAGKYKDTNGPSTFNITSLAPDQSISVKCAAIGSGNPGSDWTVQIFMEP